MLEPAHDSALLARLGCAVAGCASVEFVSFRAGARSGFTENGAQCGGLRVAAYTHAVWSATTVRDRCVVSEHQSVERSVQAARVHHYWARARVG